MKAQIDMSIKKFDFEKVFEQVKGDIWQFQYITIGEPVGVIEVPDSLIETNSAYFASPVHTVKRVIIAARAKGIL
ncbi:hypothetical protein LDJ78_20230 [Citrobacter portucalensis]|uniref:hypothetical protein n=1 Tax=Citrobacter portucalensis TaxID=1639133 RepID=UPI001C642601|nr:hypothetical protein [Citrobacter portucalensis]MBW7621518.1 hypothetical protein [Citrobacter portucalensis]MBW7640506.1 hypothetical protein [Citrobacter portucalensis]MCA2135068.1 hypothetical protein [Citrobacter portucalensis]MCA2145255.1 hypothetical protein [Citrobacter portucalensis]MCA2150028.1 hypothetical protein [Citrobacter portucalensis]